MLIKNRKKIAMAKGLNGYSADEDDSVLADLGEDVLVAVVEALNPGIGLVAGVLRLFVLSTSPGRMESNNPSWETAPDPARTGVASSAVSVVRMAVAKGNSPWASGTTRSKKRAVMMALTFKRLTRRRSAPPIRLLAYTV